MAWIVTTPSATPDKPHTYEVALPHTATKGAVIIAAVGKHIASGAKEDFSDKAEVVWKSDKISELPEGITGHLGSSTQYDIMQSSGNGKWEKYKPIGADKAGRSYRRLELVEKALESIASENPTLAFRIEANVTMKSVVKVALNGKTYVHAEPKPVQTTIPVKAEGETPVKAEGEKVAEPVKDAAPATAAKTATETVAKRAFKR